MVSFVDFLDLSRFSTSASLKIWIVFLGSKSLETTSEFLFQYKLHDQQISEKTWKKSQISNVVSDFHNPQYVDTIYRIKTV